MKQLEIKQGKVVCPIDNSEISIKLCNNCRKCDGITDNIVVCTLDGKE